MREFRALTTTSATSFTLSLSFSRTRESTRASNLSGWNRSIVARKTSFAGEESSGGMSIGFVGRRKDEINPGETSSTVIDDLSSAGGATGQGISSNVSLTTELSELLCRSRSFAHCLSYEALAASRLFLARAARLASRSSCASRSSRFVSSRSCRSRCLRASRSSLRRKRSWNSAACCFLIAETSELMLSYDKY